MSKKPNSLDDLSFGIGQRADGTIESFPASELAERMRKQRMEDEAQDHAISTVFPDEGADLVIGS